MGGDLGISGTKLPTQVYSRRRRVKDKAILLRLIVHGNDKTYNFFVN